jgi:lipoate-protein ligase B
MMGISMTAPLIVQDWGVLDYARALVRQQDRVKQVAAGSLDDQLILVEHPPVVTFGASSDSLELRIPRVELMSRGIDLVPTDRGGRTTFHGPGQMVAYPIIRLPFPDFSLYVKTLLGALCDLLIQYGLCPDLDLDRPGVWVSGKKIASIGIKVKNGIAFHGVALNVTVDLGGFQWIDPCGCPDVVMTSMEKELGYWVDLTTVKQCFVLCFCRRFQYELSQVDLAPAGWGEPFSGMVA